MKKLIYFSLGILFLTSCNPTAPDSAAADSAATSATVPDSVPHEVMRGSGGNWAFQPDSSFNELVLGSAASFATFWRNNGANMKTLDGQHKVMSYFNSQETEWLAVYITKDSKGKEVAYGAVLQKAGQMGAPPMPCLDSPEYLSKANVITGHGVYIGMLPEYVKGVYTDQTMMQWEKGDTLYLQYHPKEKDAKNFKYYSWNSYSATYKFVNDKLRRVECFIDPAELEKR